MKYLFSGQEMKIWEKQAMERYKIPSLLLMERAASAVVKELISGNYDLHKVLIVCGVGNNGGDGVAAARMLHARNIRVDVCVLGDPARAAVEMKRQLEMYEAVLGKMVTKPEYEEYTVIVDAIFGTGCRRVLAGCYREAVESINQGTAPVISVDIPSGVNADRGTICGCAVRASATVTFFSEKLGMALYPGREYCGRVVIERLEVPEDSSEKIAASAISFCPEDLKLLPKRLPVSHKGTYGKVLIIAGSDKISGAAYLASAGAYRSGAGLVKIYTPGENKFAMQTLLPEALLETYDRSCLAAEALSQCIKWADVIVLGPGLGTDQTAEKIFEAVFAESDVPVVLDADGLNILAKKQVLLEQMKVPVILTPHLQEMERISGISKGEMKQDMIGAANKYLENYPVILVLKDAATIVAEKGALPYVNQSGNSGMAVGGSGDVLSGIIGGLLAQGMKPLDASRLGVFIHGLAGDAAAAKKGCYSMTAADILDGIAEVTKS